MRFYFFCITLLLNTALYGDETPFYTVVSSSELRGEDLLHDANASQLAHYHNADRQMPIQITIIAGSGWNALHALTDLRQLALVYLQCSIRVNRIAIQHIILRHGRTTFHKIAQAADQESVLFFTDLLADTHLTKSMRIFYIERFSDSKSPGKSYAKWKHQSNKIQTSLDDSAWLTLRVKSQSYLDNQGDAGYSTSAHELLHILTKRPQHNQDPTANLLSTAMSKKRRNVILKKHCHEARLHRYVHKRRSIRRR